MKQEKKEKFGIWMFPEMVNQIDAAYPLHGISSRSEFVCKAVEFYLGFLQTGNSEEYINKTTLSFLEDQFAKLDARVCRQLFRMCVELSMVSHISACLLRGVTDETLKALRKKCVKDVKNTIGNIRYDRIYQYQNQDLENGEEENETDS